MRTRAKLLTVSVAMVTTFALLPAIGASAAEPLEDGTYGVTVGETTYTVEVVDGQPVVDEVEGVQFVFQFDEETGRVLDEFDVVVDDAAFEVEVEEDGTAVVTPEDEEGAEEGDDSDDDSDDGDEDDSDASADEDEDEDEDDSDASADESADADDAEDAAHGELVSTVAACAPSGKEARGAGLPNHGRFVSAAAKGEAVTFEVDGEEYEVDFADQAGAEAFCALAEGLLDGDEDDASSEEGDAEVGDASAEDDGDEDDGRGRKDKQDKERGRSGDAPGRGKKDR